ncbi:MAG: hypothetical protein A2Y60_03140 [Chloroflexi bacterium RBG_13_54_9]|nr:MAG: hypothetical protein A2Y60_03140 [Chloroflexi bacterium RBG_13_54_9]
MLSRVIPRQLFVFSVCSPELVSVTFADQKFDEQGKLTDKKAKELIRGLLEAQSKRVDAPYLIAESKTEVK